MTNFEMPGVGLVAPADEARARVPTTRQPSSSAEGLHAAADEATGCLPSALDATIAAIRAQHRLRCYAMEQRKRADLSLGAFLRMALGWRKDLPDRERKEIADMAKALVTAGEAIAKGKPATLPDELAPVIAASIAARAPFDAIEAAAEKAMVKLAKTLPVWKDWGEGVRGLGAASLAVIVAEAGDLSNYPTKGHLWKRLGLAPFGKGENTRSGAEWAKKGGLSADDWVAFGYSRQRRSRVFVIGDAMIKVGDTYRQVYLDRKAYEIARAPEIAPIAAHRRAQRYMEKRLLRDLWQAWRMGQTSIAEGPFVECPSAELIEAA